MGRKGEREMKYRSVFYRGSEVRWIWPAALLLVLVVLGEILIVDPLGSLLEKLGLVDVGHLVEHEWPSALHDILKRTIRSIVVLIAVWVPVRFLMHRPFKYTGFVFARGWVRQLGLGVAFGFLVQVIPLLSMQALGWYSVEGWLWVYQSVSVVAPALLFSFFISAETAIVEETIFRGFLMNILIRRYNVKTGVIASSVVFGLLHFSGVGNEFPWWMSLASATIAGFVFAQAYLLYATIWVPLGIHFAVHFSAHILGTAGASPSEATLLVTKVEGPVLWVVTKAGGASILELAGYGAVSLLLYLMSKRRRA
jgi:membrane protease YdiL (CAAX protease family)